MHNRIYLYQMKDHFIPDDDESGVTHRLARKFFEEIYLEKYQGIPLYADMDIRYEELKYEVTTQILASFGHTFIIDQNPLYEDEDGITLTIDEWDRASIKWLRPEFGELYKENRRYSEIISTYSSWDIFRNLFILRDNITNRKAKHVLESL